MTLSLRWRVPPRSLQLRWRGPEGMATALARDPSSPIAAVIATPGADAPLALELAVTAAEAISGHRAVTLDASGAARIADARTLPNNAVLGLSMHAAAAGAQLTLRYHGPAQDVAWSFVPGAIFLRESGGFSQTPPTSGAIVQFGTVIGADRMLVRPRLVARL